MSKFDTQEAIKEFGKRDYISPIVMMALSITPNSTAYALHQYFGPVVTTRKQINNALEKLVEKELIFKRSGNGRYEWDNSYAIYETTLNGQILGEFLNNRKVGHKYINMLVDEVHSRIFPEQNN